MRALLTCASFAPDYGGPALSVPSLAQALSEEGVDVSLWAPDGSASLTQVLAPDCSIVESLSASLAADVDLVHDNGIWLPYNHGVARFAARHAIPRIVSPRGMLSSWAVNYKKFRKDIAWLLYQKRDLEHAAALHVTATQEADDVKRLLTNARIFSVPNGMTVPAATGSEKQAPFLLVYLGRIHPKKGIDMLLQAWSSLKPRDWQLIIAGNDQNDHKAELQKMTQDLGLTDSVRISEPLYGQDKENFYLDASLFILPSHSENFGMTVAEALSYGVPAIATDTTPWQIIVDEGCGWLAAPTIQSITEQLSNALSTTPQQRMTMGLKGRSLIEQQFRWDAIARSMLSNYIEVLKA